MFQFIYLCKKYGDFVILEEHLKSIESQKELSLHLSNLDKSAVVAATNCAMKFCLTYELAKEFSFLGTRNDKRAFNNCNLKNTMVEAVQISFTSTSRRVIENGIKMWLKRAPKSYELQQQRKREAN